MFSLVVAYFFCAPSEYCYQGLPLFSFAILVFPECLTNQIHQLNISFKDPNDDQSNPLRLGFGACSLHLSKRCFGD